MTARLEWAATSPASIELRTLAQWPEPVTLWNLMRQFKSNYFFALSRTLEQSTQTLINARSGALSGEVIDVLRVQLARIRSELEPFDLPVSVSLVERLDRSLKHETGLIGSDIGQRLPDLAMRIEDELKTTLILQVPKGRVEYYSVQDAFGVNVTHRFPKVVDDLEEAGNCYALGRYTACVFHLMRVLEIGVQALATDLGITAVERNWQALLDNLRGAIKRLPRSTQAEKDSHSDRQEAVAHLQAVKDAWRNDVMHPRASYTEEQALDVWNHSKPLMAKLAEIV